MRPVAVAAAVLATTLVSASVAHADDTHTSAQTERRWYGWQGLGLDLAAGALFFGGAYTDGSASSGFMIAGLGTYALGAPLVHFSHGETGRGAASLALRWGLPAVTAAITYAQLPESCTARHEDCGYDLLWPVVTGVLAAGGAALVDDFFLGWERVPEERRWTPTLAPAPGGVTLGLAGTW